MLRRTNDPLSDFTLWDDDQEQKLNKRPECAECGWIIQDEYGYVVDGKWYCEECIRDAKTYIDEGD